MLTHAEQMMLYGAIVFFAGVFLSQRIKDWMRGVPSELRSGLQQAETLAMAKLKEEASNLVNLLHASIQISAPGAPSAPPVPAAPTPPAA
jgi:hypothetical protein